MIRQQLSDLRKWQEWNVMLSNPSLTHVHVAESIFKSDQLNVRMTSSDSVRTVWMQKNGNVIFSGINVIPSSSDTTIVQWYFDFHLKWYPWEKFGSIVFDRQLGPVMEKSLEKLGDLFTNSP